jgi:hypothetical protein
MRRAYVLIGLMVLVGLGAGLAMAEDRGRVATHPAGMYGVGPVEEGFGTAEAVDCGCSECQAQGGCNEGGWPGCGCSKCGAYRASMAQFNCACRGSYKFPVPPQYTYHWPGMYSQRTMTEYNSPWRFPALEIPAEEAQRLSDLPDDDSPLRQTTIRLREASQAETVPVHR